ncbi:hypothetical protein BSKO_09772 [Bryopsis sp. KO-2023]|nr:hypothetical protein BSKO_09772 [Bryopsis sp. KO-2023]
MDAMAITSSDVSSDDSLNGNDYPLHDAAENGDIETLRFLLQKDKEEDTVDKTKEKNRNEEIRKLMESFSGIDQLDNDEASPLHLAILNGHLECMEELLSSQADVRLGCDGNPPLHMVVCQGMFPEKAEFASQAAKLLLENGASPYERDDHGMSALHWAAILGLSDVVRLLLEWKPEAQSEQSEKEKEQEEADSQDMECVPLIELQDRQGDTPIHLAARNCQPEILEILLNFDKDVDPDGAIHTMNRQGQLPLHCGAYSGNFDCAKLLAKVAPDTVYVVDQKNRTPEDIAELRGHQSIANLLVKDPAEFDLVRKEQQSSSPEKPTYLIYSADGLDHKTAPEPTPRGMPVPPENVKRLQVLAKKGHGILRGNRFSHAVWDEKPPLAEMADVLRVHDWNYVHRVKTICEAVSDNPSKVAQMDGDTVLSGGSFKAALRAAGAVCRAVDRVMTGDAQNSFCIVRPPGHHAGPLGKVTCKNDPSGSHGFCLLNNIAIGASYALNVYRRSGIERVAVLDFDVHHGNGTEACVLATQPSSHKVMLKTPFSEGIQIFKEYRPWLGEGDKNNILFGSVQAYGPRVPSIENSWFYPGSGATSDNRRPDSKNRTEKEVAHQGEPSVNGHASSEIPKEASSDQDPLAFSVVEDPGGEFASTQDFENEVEGPRVINVGIAGPGIQVQLWKRAWRDKILPAVVNFRPDMIFLSAGFDAHRKDDINHRFIGVLEEHYEWITEQIVQVANLCCGGRVVSALEGGYRVQGGNVSAFARSVAAHVETLMARHSQKWNEKEAEMEREADRLRREKRLKEREARKRSQELARQEHAAAQDGSSRPKRQRPNVDYAELNKKLEEEESRGKKAPPGESAR